MTARFTLSAFGDEIADDVDEQLRVLDELDIGFLELRSELWWIVTPHWVRICGQDASESAHADVRQVVSGVTDVTHVVADYSNLVQKRNRVMFARYEY